MTSTYHFSGTVTTKDAKTHVPHAFEVPEGTTNIHIEFDYGPEYATGRIHRNQINVSLSDPNFVRGVWFLMRGGEFDVNGSASSIGFRSDPIQPGTWTAYVQVHRILSPDPVNYEMDVTLSTEPVTATLPTYDGSHRVASSEPGWYRGDLHAHTIHSDGRWDVPEFTKFMRNRGLDFVTLSDHNVVTGLDQHRSQTEDGFLAMGGMELSTFNGHMLALGNSNWYEWRLGIAEGVDILSIMQQAIDQGSFLVIAHPMSIDEPFCSGCHWLFEEARPGLAHGVEIWNGFWHMFNEEGLQQYYAWLNLGNRLVATSGTDIHGPHPLDTDRRAAFNCVYAEELSEQGILNALRKGHSYVSAEPELLMTAKTTSGEEAMVGDLLPAEAAEITVKWSGAHEGDVLRWIVDGKVREQQAAAESGEVTWTLDAGEAKWCNVELRDAKNDMWALTNPIFFGEW